MPQTIATLIPILRFLAAPGAGILASWLFGVLRARVSLPAAAPAAPLARLLLVLLYAPRYSRCTVLLLAGLLGIAFSVLLALVQGQALAPILDALLAALISQLWHAATDLSGSVAPTPASGVYASLQERLDDHA